MFKENVRIEYKGFWKISSLIDSVGIDFNESFETLEDITLYIESVLLGTAIAPFVITYINDVDHPKTIIGNKRINALGRYIRGDFCLTDCEFIPEISQKHFFDLPRNIQNRIENTIVSVYCVEYAKDCNYSAVIDNLRKVYLLDVI